ncbi:MAG: hypothetical protein U1E18_00380 [Brevundimonas sp.]|uniref:hypothetical protein n=1 Tax=Brevundimonas sp. TaxID=1871086 RepID=UPI00273561B5|nr:hypothetical protein [Brevundimonas sp.]MDZ4108041.1 hypothetical protein [Brevundimonas sp.]MDZ4321662.1 hypothetical protein [Phenylobacterium sp.]
MKAVSRRIFVIASLLAVGACAGEPVRTDAEIINMLQQDRSGFEQAVRLITMDPPVREMRMRRGELEVTPAGIAPERRLWLRDFMGLHGLESIEHFRGVSFTVSAAGLSVSGQVKKLVFEPTGRVTEAGAGSFVSDTDGAVAAERRRSILAYRDLGDGWFIRNST